MILVNPRGKIEQAVSVEVSGVTPHAPLEGDAVDTTIHMLREVTRTVVGEKTQVSIAHADPLRSTYSSGAEVSIQPALARSPITPTSPACRAPRADFRQAGSKPQPGARGAAELSARG